MGDELPGSIGLRLGEEREADAGELAGQVLELGGPGVQRLETLADQPLMLLGLGQVL